MSKTDTARRTAEQIQDSPALRVAARTGFVVNGLLHILIGVLALSVAFGGGGEADTGGALSQVAATPGGLVILWSIAVGLWGLAAFQLLETALVAGSDKESWGLRAKEAGKAVAYAVVGATAFAQTAGGSSDGDQQAKKLSAQVLESPGGVVALLLVSALVAGIGAYFVTKGIRRKFLEDLEVPGGTTGRITVGIGTVGYVAKGLAVVIVGVLLGVAAVTADPSEATGLDGALKTLAGLPLGTIALSAIALGLIAYGIYCQVRAVRARL